MATRLIEPHMQFSDASGEPYASGELFFFETGTSTPKDTFTTPALSVANSNPILLNVEGRPPVDVWGDGEFKFVVKSTTGVTVGTYDPVLGFDLVGSTTKDTIALMTASLKSTLNNGDIVNVGGYHTIGDGGGGAFFWDAANTSTANLGTIFEADEGGTGRWIRINYTELLFEMGGATADDPGDGTGTDDILAIQAVIDSTVVTPDFVNRGSIEMRPLAYKITDEILFNQKNIKVSGNNAIIKWAGDSSTSMTHVTDSSRIVFEDLIFLGNLDNPPAAAMCFEGLAGAGIKGTNENIIIRNVIFGRRFSTDTTTGGTADATPAGRLRGGVVIGGLDGNNDEYHFSDCQFHSAYGTDGTDGIGLDIQNTNSIWSKIDNSLFNNQAIGIKDGANFNGYNLNFNRNTVADIQGVRQTSTSIFGMQSENAKTFIESNGGASYYVTNGKLLRNDATASYFFNFNSGGHLSLKNLLIQNIQPAVGDTIRYNGGSLGGSVKVEGCDIAGGVDRDTWDINTGNTSFVDIPIDIQHGRFHFKTTYNYIDKELDPPSANPELTSLVSATAESAFGDFYNFAFQLNIQGMQPMVAYDSASTMRARFFNPTGVAINLTSGRCRWMNLGDYIKARNSAALDVPSLANGAGATLTIPVAGARLGDFAVFGVGSSFSNITTTAYVSADDTVSLHFHNATGGTNNPPSQTFHAAILEEFGSFKGGSVYTPALIADGSGITIDVTVPGAQVGAHVEEAYTKDLQGLIVTSSVSTADNVQIVVTNRTGAGVTLVAGSWKVMVAF